MNKKGFTLVELLVTIAIASLVLSLGAITMNNIINTSQQKTTIVARENIKKSANLYSKEFNDEIVWLGYQSCISLEQLISKGYLRREEVKDATYDYVIIEKDKDDNATIISELTTDEITKPEEIENIEKLCKTIIYKKASVLTNKEICKDLKYDGTSKILHINQTEIGDIYSLPNPGIQKTNADSYLVPINLKEGYKWSDGSVGTKNVYCTIEKGIPNMMLKDSDGNEIYGQDAEKTIPVEITITSNIGGIIELKSSNDKYVSVELAETNASKDFSLESKNGQYEKKIIIKNNANRDTNTYITIKLIPNNSNYQITTKTYIIGKITDIKRDKPTSATYCTNPYYNSMEQTITIPEKIGYTFYNNSQTNVGKYTITAKLHPGFEWEDGTKNDITLECSIKDLKYKVHYVGNSNTGQTYTDNNQCTDNKCGLDRYETGSKYDSSTNTFKHNRDYIFGSSYNLVLNRFIKTGYSFKGWSETENGTVKYNEQHEVKNLIDPKNKPNGTIVKLYANWAINTGIIYFYPNGGTPVEAWPLLDSSYGDGSYVGASSAVQPFDYNNKTLNVNNVTSLFTRTGYHISSDETAWRVGSTTATTYLNQASQDMSSYVKNKNNVRLKVYANWTPNQYKISYNANGGSGTMTASTHKYDADSNLTANGFSRTGYTFTGWKDNNGNTYTNKQEIKNLTATNGATITLTAQWKQNTYTVNYNANGGSGTTASSSHTYDVEKALTANEFSRTGYTFAGWKDGDGKTYSNQQKVKNLTATNGATITLTAIWNPQTYTVKYDANGGSGTMQPSSHNYNVESKLTANAFTRVGYRFTGWKDSDGNSYSNQTTIKTLANPGETKILYAQWTINKVYVKYSVNGGTITSTTTSDSGTKYTWTTNTEGGIAGVISKSSNGGAASSILNTINYGGSLGNDGLNNWNNSKYINIARSGYYVSANEWKCLSGNCKKTEYDHATVYTAAELCDASENDCTIVLGVNWTNRDITAPTCTITYSTTNWTDNGVGVTVKCNDSGSGCATATKTETLKSSKTYTVKDNEGNAGSCTASITSRTVYLLGVYSTFWEAECWYTETGMSGYDMIYAVESGFTSEKACKQYCQDIKLSVGWIEPRCSTYKAWDFNYGNTWSTSACDTSSAGCKSKTQYKKN